MPPPASEPTRSFDVVVVGAGIVGIACALQLQLEGRSVVVVDPEPPGEKCSYGNSGSFGVGIIAPASMPGVPWRIPRLLLDPRQPLFVALSQVPQLLPWFRCFVRSCNPERVLAIARARHSLLSNTLAAYQPLFERAQVQSMIRPSGMLFVYENAASLDRAAAAFRLAREHGVEIRMLDGDAARSLNPAIGSAIVAAAHFPANVHTTNPSRLVKELANAVVAGGGELRRARVLAIDASHDAPQAIRTDSGTMHARDVVVAAGVWSRALVRGLGHRVLLAAERGYHVMLPEPGIEFAMPAMLAERSVVLTPMEHGLRITGIAEFFDADAPPARGRAEMILGHARACVPGLRADRYTTWVGARPSTPDSLPVISTDPRHRRVHFAFGHGPSGLAMGGITARLVADLVTGRPASVDLSPFSIERFS